MNTELLNTPVHEWKVAQLLGIGWNDGFTEALCDFAHPLCSLHFQIVAYETQSRGRLYSVHLCPTNSIVALLPWLTAQEMVQVDEDDCEGFFFPVDSPHQAKLDEQLQRVLAQSVPLALLVESDDLLLLRFTGLQAMTPAMMEPNGEQKSAL